ncbi:MAG: sugar transferase, partial [Cyanobacteria bacterium P01_H01_bin.121]
FRTMVRHADRVLEDYLVRHPEERLTWLRSQKLKCDPRITTIGKFLRRTSLDELPQLLNVLCREMSLVGPRPIVDEEVAHYRDKFSLYVRVLPGITGLWQVSGRSDTTYEQRVSLDAYYVRNWSVWLDTYILIKTLWVVLEGKGAY